MIGRHLRSDLAAVHHHMHSVCAIRLNEEEEGELDDPSQQEVNSIPFKEQSSSIRMPLYCISTNSPLISLWVIATIGLLCNGLNLLVLATSEARRMPSWHLLVSLALFDSLFLLFAVLELTPTSLLPTLFPQSAHLVSVHTRAVLIIRMFASTFYKASILIVVAFNVERYLCVCRPLWAHRARILVGGGKALAVVGGALGLGMVCSVQWPLAWTVVQCEGEEEEGNGQQTAGDDHLTVVTIRQSPTLQAYYRLMDWLCLLLFNLAPILLLSVLNVQLVLTLRRIVRRDSSASAGTAATTVAVGDERGSVVVANVLLEEEGHAHVQPTTQQHQTLNANAMLFAVVLLLFVCIGPQVPARLLYEWHGHYYDTGAVLYTCISQQLVFLNASLNFCLYCLVSRRYRSLLHDTIFRLMRHCRHPRPKRHNCVAKFGHQCRRRRLRRNERQQQQSTSSSTGGSSREEEQRQAEGGRRVTLPLLELNTAGATLGQ